MIRYVVFQSKLDCKNIILAEYLFGSGLSESFTPSALLRDIIEQLLHEYQDRLAAYEKLQSLSNTRIQEHN